MVKIEIRTENVAGDEELVEVLRVLIDAYENEGEVAGLIKLDGEDYAWAINPPEPLVRD